MKQAIQLEIDFGPEFRRVSAAATPSVQPSVIDAVELRALSAARTAVKAARRALPMVLLFLQSLVAVCFCFAMMFFAALLQG